MKVKKNILICLSLLVGVVIIILVFNSPKSAEDRLLELGYEDDESDEDYVMFKPSESIKNIFKETGELSVISFNMEDNSVFFEFEEPLIHILISYDENTIKEISNEANLGCVYNYKENEDHGSCGYVEQKRLLSLKETLQNYLSDNNIDFPKKDK